MSAGPPHGNRPAEHRPIAPTPRAYSLPATHQTDPPARPARPLMHTVGRRSEQRPAGWKVPGIWPTVGLALPHNTPPARTRSVPRSPLGNASGIRTALPEHPTTKRPPSTVDHDPPSTCDSLDDDQRIHPAITGPTRANVPLSGPLSQRGCRSNVQFYSYAAVSPRPGAAPCPLVGGGERVHPSDDTV